MREPLLTQLLDGYNPAWGAADKNAFLAQLLQFRHEATEDRLFHDEPICCTAQNVGSAHLALP